jgi:hypothetical protein
MMFMVRYNSGMDRHNSYEISENITKQLQNVAHATCVATLQYLLLNSTAILCNQKINWSLYTLKRHIQGMEEQHHSFLALALYRSK